MIADLASTVADDPATTITDVGRRYRNVTGFRDALVMAYRCLLVRLDDGTPEQLSEECEGDEEAVTQARWKSP